MSHTGLGFLNLKTFELTSREGIVRERRTNKVIHKETLTLPSGKVVVVTMKSSGQVEVEPIDGGILTDDEWLEYTRVNLERSYGKSKNI